MFVWGRPSRGSREEVRLMRSNRSKRRGVSAVLAMLFLVLFSSLAVGFYAAVNTSVQIAHNETYGRRALLAAESGMEFIRYQLSNIAVPQGTKPEDMWTVACTQLKSQMDRTAN